MMFYIGNIKLTSQNIWFTMKFCTDIHGLQKMSPDDFGDPLTLPRVPSPVPRVDLS